MSKSFLLNVKDVLNGAITATFGAVSAFVGQLIFTHSFNLEIVAYFALGSFFTYLGKRFMSDSQGNFLGNQ